MIEKKDSDEAVLPDQSSWATERKSDQLHGRIYVAKAPIRKWVFSIRTSCGTCSEYLMRLRKFLSCNNSQGIKINEVTVNVELLRIVQAVLREEFKESKEGLDRDEILAVYTSLLSVLNGEFDHYLQSILSDNTLLPIEQRYKPIPIMREGRFTVAIDYDGSLLPLQRKIIETGLFSASFDKGTIFVDYLEKEVTSLLETGTSDFCEQFFQFANLRINDAQMFLEEKETHFHLATLADVRAYVFFLLKNIKPNAAALQRKIRDDDGLLVPSEVYKSCGAKRSLNNGDLALQRNFSFHFGNLFNLCTKEPGTLPPDQLTLLYNALAFLSGDIKLFNLAAVIINDWGKKHFAFSEITRSTGFSYIDSIQINLLALKKSSQKLLWQISLLGARRPHALSDSLIDEKLTPEKFEALAMKINKIFQWNSVSIGNLNEEQIHQEIAILDFIATLDNCNAFIPTGKNKHDLNSCCDNLRAQLKVNACKRLLKEYWRHLTGHEYRELQVVNQQSTSTFQKKKAKIHEFLTDLQNANLSPVDKINNLMTKLSDETTIGLLATRRHRILDVLAEIFAKLWRIVCPTRALPNVDVHIPYEHGFFKFPPRSEEIRQQCISCCAG